MEQDQQAIKEAVMKFAHANGIDMNDVEAVVLRDESLTFEWRWDKAEMKIEGLWADTGGGLRFVRVTHAI